MKGLFTTTAIGLSLLMPSFPAIAGDTEIGQTETLENVMAEQGFFNRANCSSSAAIVRVRMQGSEVKNQKTLCFQNSSDWENGSYVYNFDTDRLTYRGCEVRLEDCFESNSGSQTNVNVNVNTNPQNPYVTNPNPYQPAPTPAPAPAPVAIQPQTQTFFYSLSGSQVPPHVQSTLRGVAAGQRLQIAACETPSAIHIVVNNAYGFCAYPNAQYPSGKWTINVTGLQ